MSAANVASSRTQTSPGSLGVLPQWIMALALVICAVMIFGLLTMIAVNGVSSFWPSRVEQVDLTSGESVLGVVIRERADQDGNKQVLYRVGNRDLGQTPFRWIPESQVAARSYPSDVVLLERQEWGVFIGKLRPDPEAESADGIDAFERAVADGAKRRRAMHRLRGGELHSINKELSSIRRAQAAAQLKRADGQRAGLPGLLWGVIVMVGVLALCAGFVPLVRRLRLVPLALGLGVLALLWAWLERPGMSHTELEAWYSARTAALAVQQQDAESRFQSANNALLSLEADDAEHRVYVAAIDGTLAPESQSVPDKPLKASQVIRAVQPNAMNTAERFAVFLSRWFEYLLDDPREANTEGGIFPVIIGTVTVTLLLTVLVVPFGVLAALYIREYARQGLLISVLRIAINNLAGVPSIVYGIFGLGFFCYAVGGYIDGGPDDAVTLSKPLWWILTIGSISAIVSTFLFRGRARLGGCLWAVAILALLVAFAGSPYFDGFFRVKLLDGQPTFGSSGLLWASLTLALLTLPVVIVSTEEAIAAVPQSLREASFGCGASRWQTMTRVVLPGAMPGVMTGTILAMARGAGEVAPLMVVGAVKLAPELPVEASFPFVYADRSFMHLGFHIYDLGFQSPDSEAARGMVWATTLLLIVLVVTMNLVAITIRGRLRKRLSGGHF